MLRTQRLLIVLTAFALIGGMHLLAVQDQGGTAQINGELQKVDVDAKTIAIKAADGTEVQFQYNDQTQVTGEQENVAGLATMTGGLVTVYFKMEGNTRRATKIELHKK